jgi:hypothetical protein|tara:strand:- start:929 stop:1582 length:654 start_codon:yes stop_codon:yes gene_type:complete
MILKSIYLDLDREEYSSGEVYSFLKKTRHLLNFIERECLKKIKFKTENFDRIVLTLSKESETPFVNSSKTLVFKVKKEFNSIENINSSGLIDLLIFCFKKLIEFVIIPFVEIMETIDLFIENNFENEWVYKKKKIPNSQINLVLKCKLDIDFFTLLLDAFEGKRLLTSITLLALDSDENAYKYKFKDLIIKKDTVEITSGMGEESILVPFSDFQSAI